MKKTITNPELKETVTFRQTASETEGAFTDLEIVLAPGGGNPLHYHTSYSELFTAIEGALHLELKNKQIVVLQPSQSFLVKRRVIHRFFNPGTEEIKFRNEVRPGHTGFEYTLRILQGLATDGLYNSKGVPKSLKHLAVCGIMSDMRLPGLMSLTTPLLYFIAAIAKRDGTTQKLIERYCR